MICANLFSFWRRGLIFIGMSNRSYGHGHLKFLIIAVFLMVIMDRFVLGGTRPYIEDVRENATVQAESYTAPVVYEVPSERSYELAKLAPEVKIPELPEYEPLPQWKQNAVPVDVGAEWPKIVIVIDDLGVSHKYSEQIIALPGPLTLAFLPYADGVAAMAQDGKAQGHELMVHMPMEPMNADLDPGDIYLSTDQSQDEFSAMLDRGLSAFDGYVGINNHMGSRLTQDKQAMRRVMMELRERGLLFLDSRTIATTVGAETAAAAGIPYAQRDVFLDHDPSLEGVRKALQKTEDMALEHGVAIAIGHPKPHTIEGLREWLPTLAGKGIALVPISAVVTTMPDAFSSAPPQSPELPHP